jgi:hypothetical protein
MIFFVVLQLRRFKVLITAPPIVLIRAIRTMYSKFAYFGFKNLACLTGRLTLNSPVTPPEIDPETVRLVA